MRDDEILVGLLMEDMTLEEAAGAFMVEVDWLVRHMDEGLLPETGSGERRLSGDVLLRARRMRDIEHNFDAAPELAALVADLLEEMDALKTRLRCIEPG